MRVVGEIAQRLPLPLSGPQAEPSALWEGRRVSPVFLMKSRMLASRPHDQGWHRQAP
jgi:hypothetical protein